MKLPKIDVVVFREDHTTVNWRVFVNGRITTPQFNAKGPAEAYKDMILRGERAPEFKR